MNIASTRLRNQQIAVAEHGTAREVVAWMGAMQAQDLPMAKWAIGTRLPGSTIADIETAINQGEIVRTHVLRPTWHFVSADDIYWMLKLTAPQIKASLRARHDGLGLTDSLLSKSNMIIEKALQGGKQLARERLVAEFEKSGIANEDNRAAHLLLWAELEGIICSGASSGAKQNYALLGERVPEAKQLNKEEALATLAKRYFTSHGPATLHDFVWWSGLYARDAREALELAQAQLDRETLGSQTYWFSKNYNPAEVDAEAAYLLPAFDEFVIGYRDRSAFLPAENHHRAVSSNGIFRPVTVVRGRITGIWRRATKGRRVELEVESFEEQGETTKEQIAQSASRYGRFLEKEVRMRFKDQPD